MPSASVVSQNWKPPTNISPLDQFGNPASFAAAAKTQASDYDKIMAQYGNIIQNSTNNPISPASTPQVQDTRFNPSTFTNASFKNAASNNSNSNMNFTPSATSENVRFNPNTVQTSQYAQSGDVTNSLAGLSDLATTGGYSAADKQDIRARDISPIRSIYANAQQNAQRGRALSGGYSPNFNAVQAQMARDEANKIGDITTAANAGIAQNVASNRLSAAPNYASAAANANAAKTAADQKNADIINQINEFNSRGQSQTDQFNAANKQQTNMFNAAGQADANRFNASQANVNNLTNAAEENRMNMFNASGQADVNKFNAQAQAANDQANAARQADANKFNINAQLDAAKLNSGNTLAATQGMTNLYGTTPALTSLFGNQVTQAAQLGQGQQQLDQNKLKNIVGMASGYQS